jgi:hypothetical protein
MNHLPQDDHPGNKLAGNVKEEANLNLSDA